MTRYIDADALKKSLDEHDYLVHHGFNESEYGITQYGVKQIIDDAPTIDAVPVIRCKDCKYYPNGIRFCIDSYAHCSHMIDDGFCSWAVRKGEE